jgi:hypothetical protein
VLPEAAVVPATDEEGGPVGDFPLPDDDAARAAAAEGGPFRRPDNDAYWLSGDPARWRDYVPADVVDVLSIPVAPRRGGGAGVA